MEIEWGRVRPTIEATKNGKPIEAKVEGYSLVPSPEEGLHEFGYYFVVNVGKRDINLILSRTQVLEMLREIDDREWGQVMEDDAAESDVDEFNVDEFLAGLFAEEPEPAPTVATEAEAESVFDYLMAAMTYKPTADQKKARDLLDAWGWENIDYHRDGHLIRATGNGNTHTWHAPALVAQDEAKERGEFVSATMCPIHGDTFLESFGGSN
jgi:hypothetical protein